MPLADYFTRVFQGLRAKDKADSLAQQEINLKKQDLLLKAQKQTSENVSRQAQDKLSQAETAKKQAEIYKTQTEALGLEQGNLGTKIDNMLKLTPPPPSVLGGEAKAKKSPDPQKDKNWLSKGADAIGGFAPDVLKSLGLGGVQSSQGPVNPQTTEGPLMPALPEGFMQKPQQPAPPVEGAPVQRQPASLEPQTPPAPQGIMPFPLGKGEGAPEKLPSFDLPTPPEFKKLQRFEVDAKGYRDELIKYNETLRESLPEYDDALKKQKAVQEAQRQVFKNVSKQRFELMNRYQVLKNNTPTFNDAIQNVGWNQKISAIFQAGGLGVAIGEPLKLLNNMINWEMSSLKTKHDSQLEIIEQSDNLYTSFYDMLKDENSAMMATENALMENVKQKVEYQKLISSNEKEIMGLNEVQTELDNKIALNNNAIDKQKYDYELSLAMEKTKNEWKTIDEKAKRRGSLKDMLQLQKLVAGERRAEAKEARAKQKFDRELQSVGGGLSKEAIAQRKEQRAEMKFQRGEEKIFDEKERNKRSYEMTQELAFKINREIDYFEKRNYSDLIDRVKIWFKKQGDKVGLPSKDIDRIRLLRNQLANFFGPAKELLSLDRLSDKDLQIVEEYINRGDPEAEGFDMGLYSPSRLKVMRQAIANLKRSAKIEMGQ